MVSVYINELNLIVFTVYRPPPNHKKGYYGKVLENSFKSIVLDNINKVMLQYPAPVPDVILTGDFNFPKAKWTHGIGEAFATSKSEKESLEQLINIASNFNLLQKVSKGTRETRTGKDNALELVFTNNHELISNLYIERSKLTDHKYVICETSHQTTIDSQRTEMPVESNLATYNYERTNWKDLKAKFQLLNWNEILS